jgi:hypothetical protein
VAVIDRFSDAVVQYPIVGQKPENAALRRMALPMLVDRFDAMRKLQRADDGRFYLSADNLHTNDEGYQRLTEQLAATIIAALSQGSGTMTENRTATRASTVETIPPVPLCDCQPVSFRQHRKDERPC